MNIDNVIKEAIKQAGKVNFCFKLGAVVFNNDRIISAGYNRSFDGGSNCAEVLAIRKAPSALLNGTTILVCRVRSSGTFGMSKPCRRCKSLIKKSGIRRVIYSTPDGWETYMV